MTIVAERVGGLNVGNMNKGYGGENMRNTLIEHSEGYLGPYHDAANPRMVNAGQMQDLVYGKDADIDYGPFYLAMDIRESLRHDTLVALSPDKVSCIVCIAILPPTQPRAKKCKMGLAQLLNETQARPPCG